MDKQEFSKILKRIGWTHKQFADRCEYHRNTVYGWERVPKIVELYICLIDRMIGGGHG